MAEFRLERFKYNWKGDWTANVSYNRDDVVRVNGKSYVCVITHVSNPVFRTDLDEILPGSVPPQPQPKWVVMTNGFSFVGDWTVGTDYNLGDIVKYNGSLWLCSTNHSASVFASESNNWTAFSTVTSFVGEWNSSTSYTTGAVVKYNGNLYRCKNTHASSSILETNIDDWTLYLEGIEWRSNWAGETEYRLNDFVKYGASLYRCTETHTSVPGIFDDSKFAIEVFGSQFDGTWVSTKYYNLGDLVRHEGFVYYAISNNYNSKPFIDSDIGATNNWILLSRNTNFVGSWSIDGIYKTGDSVLRGGNLYLALRDIGGELDEQGNLISGELLDGSTLDYLDPETWELMIPGIAWKGSWTSGTIYSKGDIITFKGTAYTWNYEHEASFVNFPGDNGSGYEYWDILIQAGQPAALEQKGDLLTYGLNRQFDNDGSTVFDDSSLGDTRLAIGKSEQLLSVSENLEVFWRDVTEDAETVFVSTNGIDGKDRGTFQKPFRTIRYAAEYVEDTYEAGKPVLIRVSTGKFEEIAPIVVPAGCSINGDELRSTTVLANSPIAEYENDYQYLQEYLDYFTTIFFDLTTGVQITPQEGNTAIQTYLQETTALDNEGNPIIGEDGQPVTNSNNFPISDVNSLNYAVQLFTDYKNYIEFQTSDGIVSPAVSGANTEVDTQSLINASLALNLNREFIQEELASYIINQHPTITFNKNRLKVDVWFLLKGIERDLKYSGNYGTLLSAQRYANAVVGSATSNLFYMRDTTGLRDMTTGGLKGVLNPPGVFELYQKPTGGALVSLDPGWGPDDQRTWIKNRSPYIQGVTNTGDGCIGMKVDGALHTGGNKSMTANDFTQVLSDGIGAWVTNNARAELVSVFTYYCQIGYFAEDGGIIRAANGNNSYGRYGSIADGSDDTEVPQQAAAFNRNNQAQVSEAFAGGSNDELFAFEYSNAGENYTVADGTIVGAGANADVEYLDFRDGGLFEARLISPDGSSKPNGAGYLRRQSSAQETADASSTIKLSSSETIQFLSEIEGMRIIVTGGTGVGQYGYIDNYNGASKEVTVRRDSDGNLGWDHIIQGRPLVPAFDLTTRYKIEPRVIVEQPLYSTTSGNLFTNRSYVDAAFGTISETYTGVTAGGNVIWRDDTQTRVLFKEAISDTAIQFDAILAINPSVPLNIKGRTTGTTATITNISANTGEVIEADVDANGSNFQVGEELDLVFVAGTGNTFDDDASAATFNIVRNGIDYAVTLVLGGAGYSVNDKINIPGTSLGGTSPANDLTITVTDVTDDSTSSIVTFTQAGQGRGGRFVSLTASENARFSDDGDNWTEVTLPFIGDYKSLIAGNDRFLAIASSESRLATSLNGITWTETALPLDAAWNNGVFGAEKFVIVATDDDRVLSSSNGSTWTMGSIPNDTDGGVDSTTSVWRAVTYGSGKYLAVSYSDDATATSTDGVNWIRHDSALVSGIQAVDVEYGNGRFVVVGENGVTAYRFDGIIWYESSDFTSVVADFKPHLNSIKYDNGVFFVIGKISGTTATNACFTSPDGVSWIQRELPASQIWSALAYGNNSWTIKASAASDSAIARASVGSTAFVRAEVDVGTIRELRIIDPGSNYNSATPPTIEIIDPNATFDVAPESRIGNGVLAQPSFINRGSGYRSTTSIITVSGDGYADIIPVGNTLTISGVINVPGPGVQITIEGIEDPTALIPGTLYIFSGVTVEDLGDDGTGNETKLVRFQISPRLDVEYVVPHGTQISLREKFSQCRISGHDFLDIGTGNFEQTNYPKIYSGGAFFTAAPENEVYEANGGRVFYVSTDQDGNFRTGELFSVQQATGVVTISAEFFDLDGLSELALGGVRLGGSGTVVNEFSTDPTFAADSNNVIPTQRAIVTFLADRLSVGGESLEVNKLQAGRVLIGGEPENEINTNTGQYLLIPKDVVFDGTFETNDGEGNITTEQTAISGTIVSQMLIFKQFDDSMQ